MRNRTCSQQQAKGSEKSETYRADLARGKGYRSGSNMSDDKKAKLIKIKEKKLKAIEEKIYLMNDTIRSTATVLREKKTGDKSVRVSHARHESHKKTLELDSEKRPCDRDYDIRSYSRMDSDIWKYPDVREWFNKDAKPVEQYKFSPTESGYTIRV